MEMLGGEVDFSVDGLMWCFEAEFTLAFVCCSDSTIMKD